MSYIREMLGDKFDAKVEEGKRSAIFGQSCSELDRDELLAALAIAMDQYQGVLDMRDADQRMQKAFADARRTRYG